MEYLSQGGNLQRFFLVLNQRRRQDFDSGGGTVSGVGLVGGQRFFENFQKVSRENCKNALFLLFISKKFKTALIFRAFRRQIQIVGKF